MRKLGQTLLFGELMLILKKTKRDQFETEFSDKEETRKVKISHARAAASYVKRLVFKEIASFCVTSCLASGIDSVFNSFSFKK